MTKSQPSPNFQTAEQGTPPMPQLLEQLVDVQHRHLSETLPYLIPLANKVARVHGSRHANLHEVYRLVVELEETLEPLLEWREKELYPLVQGDPGAPAALEAMADAHMMVCRLLSQLRCAADGYRVPENGCASYRTLYRELEALEKEQLAQLRLEQQLLLPHPVCA